MRLMRTLSETRTPYITTMRGLDEPDSTFTPEAPSLSLGAFFTDEQAAENPRRAASAIFSFLFITPSC